jgi:hypothetical protein
VGAQPLLRSDSSHSRVISSTDKYLQFFSKSHLDKPSYVITFWSSFGQLIKSDQKLSKIPGEIIA